MANEPKQSPQGIKMTDEAKREERRPLDLNPRGRAGTKVRSEVKYGIIALVALVVLAIVMGIFRHGSKKNTAASMGLSDKPIQSAASPGEKVASNLAERAQRRKARAAALEGTATPAGAVPAGDVGEELDLPPTKIAQNGMGGRAVPGNGQSNGPQTPHQPTKAELRAQAAEAEELAARNSTLSKGSSTRSNSSGPGAPAPPLNALDALSRSLSNGMGAGAPNGGLGAESGGQQGNDPNGQTDKSAFLERTRKESGDAQFEAVSRVRALSRYEIKAGWDIPATLDQGMDSDLPGDIRGVVRENVYDTATGRYLLIPQGSRVVGTYNSHVTYGQKGLQVVWSRLIYPDGSSISLGALNGQDVRGLSGFRDKVDNHYARLIGTALLTSVFAAGIELSQRQNNSTTGFQSEPTVNQTVSAAIGQQIGELGIQIAQKNLSIQPTITIPIGYRFTIRVRKDLIFDAPYSPEAAAWK